jgi:pimeloyl-ACP methyl ester carboxylesterase
MSYSKPPAPPSGSSIADIQGDGILGLLKEGNTLLANKSGVCLFNKGNLDMVAQLPLPGLVIFVHGVNSDGEWYSEAEEGLCAGLNKRLRRRDEDLAHKGVEAGQLKSTQYLSELTADGFINPNMSSKTFISSDDAFSPVIRFRWGYKANSEELQKYSDGIYLNEEDYWGGGPFANGCTSLPDLWGQGLSDQLFLWLHIQHMNPTNDRQVYNCPPRPYYVLAAFRLAKLVESLRKQQADIPITIVCHSQGNMIGIAAAFLGDRMTGQSGVNCVADSYVLCNAPYSLVESNFSENMTQGDMKDREGGTGRQTEKARVETLKAFFKIIGEQKSRKQDDARVDARMANCERDFDVAMDRKRHGYKDTTYGRVTLYSNPHDQVISSTSVQGIGWRGMSAAEIAATGGAGVFTQRVFAQGFEVGKPGVTSYDGWSDHWRKPKKGDKRYWFPESPLAQYSLSKGLTTNSSVLGSITSVLMWPIFKIVLGVARVPINALPPDDWKLPLEAPPLIPPFLPEAKRFGISSLEFDQGFDAPGQSRDKSGEREAGDPYGNDSPIPKGGSQGKQTERSDKALGDKDSEASLRYEHHAFLRMQAKRDKMYKNGQKVTEEDNPDEAGDEYNRWRSKQIKASLAANVDSHATDHSTIMTNGMHAEKALAYDVAIGCCEIPANNLRVARYAADWRFLEALKDEDINKVFSEYFLSGKFRSKSPYDWANASPSGEGGMPVKIFDERQSRARQKQEPAQ